MSDNYCGGDWRDGEVRTAEAEIERLRKELVQEKEEHDRCTMFHAIAVKERNYERVLVFKRDAEIERLRGLLSDMQIVMNSHNNIVGNLQGEIERLRGLLREGLDHHDEYNWQQRVREALGEWDEQTC